MRSLDQPSDEQDKPMTDLLNNAAKYHCDATKALTESNEFFAKNHAFTEEQLDSDEFAWAKDVIKNGVFITAGDASNATCTWRSLEIREWFQKNFSMDQQATIPKLSAAIKPMAITESHPTSSSTVQPTQLSPKSIARRPALIVQTDETDTKSLQSQATPSQKLLALHHKAHAEMTPSEIRQYLHDVPNELLLECLVQSCVDDDDVYKAINKYALTDPRPPKTRVFIGNLSYDTTEDDLAKAFARFGSIEDATVIREKSSNRSKGYGFISFGTSVQASNACRHGTLEVQGRQTQISLANSRTERPERNGRRARDRNNDHRRRDNGDRTDRSNSRQRGQTRYHRDGRNTRRTRSRTRSRSWSRDRSRDDRNTDHGNGLSNHAHVVDDVYGSNAYPAYPANAYPGMAPQMAPQMAMYAFNTAQQYKYTVANYDSYHAHAAMYMQQQYDQFSTLQR